MKPFDLEAAKNQAPVLIQLKNGETFAARIICFDRLHPNSQIIALSRLSLPDGRPIYFDNSETQYFFNLAGQRVDGIKLVMAPTKKKAWANVYKYKSGLRYTGIGFDSKELAEVANDSDNYIKTILIDEWEE